jgi:hypothetical protein
LATGELRVAIATGLWLQRIGFNNVLMALLSKPDQPGPGGRWVWSTIKALVGRQAGALPRRDQRRQDPLCQRQERIRCSDHPLAEKRASGRGSPSRLLLEDC